MTRFLFRTYANQMLPWFPSCINVYKMDFVPRTPNIFFRNYRAVTNAVIESFWFRVEYMNIIYILLICREGVIYYRLEILWFMLIHYQYICIRELIVRYSEIIKHNECGKIWLTTNTNMYNFSSCYLLFFQWICQSTNFISVIFK